LGAHAISVRLSVYAEGRSGIEGVTSETTSGGRGVVEAGLSNAGLGTIAVICESITGGTSGRRAGAVWTGERGCRRPASLFGIRTTDGFHGPLKTMKNETNAVEKREKGDRPSSCRYQSRTQDIVWRKLSVSRPSLRYRGGVKGNTGTNGCRMKAAEEFRRINGKQVRECEKR
jgi:hypothetical protein